MSTAIVIGSTGCWPDLKGRLTLVRDGNGFQTMQVGARAWKDTEVDAMRLVYEDGRLLVDDAFADVRLRAAAWL